MDIAIITSAEAMAAHRRLRDDAGLLRVLAREMDVQNKLTESHIQRARMSQRGPETLGVISNRLRNSIRPSKTVILANGLRSSIGSNVRYMGPHEFGFDGDVTVGPYKRKRKVTEVIFGKRRRVRKGDINVRSHQRHVVIKERAPIRKGIEDRRVAYGTALGGAMHNFYEGR